jgi:RNA polymerase sigma-70 factor (ECF subfamily)
VTQFRQIFEAHSSVVWRTLHRLGVHPDSVDDAAQDVFLIVHRKLGEFEGRSQLSTWIVAVTYRVALNYRRRIKKTVHEEFLDQTISPLGGPDLSLQGLQAAQFVSRFCRQLTEGKRDVFVLCVLEERTAPEVAKILDMKLNTVYSRLRHARAEFREALAAFSGADSNTKEQTS